MTKLELYQVGERINLIQNNLSNPGDLSDCQIDYYTAELGLLIDLLTKSYKQARIRESGMILIQGGK